MWSLSRFRRKHQEPQAARKILVPVKPAAIDGTFEHPGRFLKLMAIPTFWRGRATTRLAQAEEHDVNSVDYLHQLNIATGHDFVAHHVMKSKSFHGIL